MGLFSLLFGGGSRSTVEELDDRIWRTSESKFNGISKQLQERNTSAVILLIGHFEDTLERLTAIADACSGDVPLKATLAENLSTDIAARLNIEESAIIDLVVAERHPLFTTDEAVRRFAEEIPCHCRLVYHLSLEDPVLSLFVSGFVKKVLDSLGMKDDEPMESNMVSRRIKTAQQRIEATAIGNSRAASADEWLQLNMPTT